MLATLPPFYYYPCNLPMDHDDVTIEKVRAYWGKKNIPQQWYSKKQPFTLAWFNEINYKRYHRYYPYLKEEAEFAYHQNEEVLEVGCGLGTDLVEYAKGGAQAHGIDLGEDQIMLTKLNFNLCGLPYKEIKVGNAENLPFPDGKFDLVVGIGVLHHTPDTAKAIKEIHRVLKPDGTALILVYARGWKHYIKRCLIHGLLKGRYFANRFNWQKVYNEVSEIHGFTPKTAVYTKHQVKAMFKDFPNLEIKKKRLGEFFEYRPYGTVMFPKFIGNIARLLNLEAVLGENWWIRAHKTEPPKDDNLWNVLFKHY